MISVREALPAEAESWLHEWRGRLHAWYARADVSEEWTRHHVERRVSNHVESLRPSVFVLSFEGTDVGFLAAAQSDKQGPPTTVVTDVWIDPAHRRRGHAAAGLRWAQPWAAQQGKRFVIVTDPSDPAQDALFASFPLRAHNMIKRASEVSDLGTDLSGHPMTEVEYGPWRAMSAQGYADDIADSGLMTREEAAERAEEQLDEFIPQGLHTPDHTFWFLRAGSDEVANLWLGHHFQPATTWVCSVDVHEAHRGKGYGRAMMRWAEQATLSSSDTHVGLNVFGHNTVAINLYQGLGYHTVDQSRSITF